MRKKEHTHKRSGWRSRFLENTFRELPKKLKKEGGWVARLDDSYNSPHLLVSVPLDASTTSQKEWFLNAVNYFKNYTYKYSKDSSNLISYAKLKYLQGGNLKRKNRAYGKKKWIRAEYRNLKEESRKQLDERIKNLRSDQPHEQKSVLSGKSRFEKCAFLIQTDYKRIMRKDLPPEQIKKAIYS